MVLEVMNRKAVRTMRILNENDIEIMKKVVAKVRGSKMDLTIIEDTAQKVGKHEEMRRFFEKCGIKFMKNTLPIGDYAFLTGAGKDILNSKIKQIERDESWARYKNNDIRHATDRGISTLTKIDLMCTYNVAVDTKMSLYEVLKNVSGLTENRVEQQFMRAKNAGVTLYILILQKDINNVEDIRVYCNKNGYNFDLLINRIQILENRYGIHYYICPPEFGALTTLALLTTDSSITGTDVQAMTLPSVEEILAMNTLKTDVIAKELFRLSDKIEKLEKIFTDLIIEKTEKREEILL